MGIKNLTERDSAEFIRNLLRNESALYIVLVSFISSDNNMTKEQIKENLKYLYWMSSGIQVIKETTLSKEEKRLFYVLKENVNNGIEILKRDISLVEA